MRHTNFTQCTVDVIEQLSKNDTFRDLYGWKGPVQHIQKNSSAQISTWGCKQVCGTGVDYYPWSQSSSTISTWVLPIIGVLVQAPFASNAFWDTVFTMARWIGSPMASLAYILWNIRVTGRAALMVDMSVAEDKRVEEPDTNFGSIRDSFYILTAMNQYSLNQGIRSKREAEGLLRIVLFSKNLRLLKKNVMQPDTRGRSNSPMMWDDPADASRPRSASSSTPLTLEERCEPDGHLNNIRQKLALQFRSNRKRGIVPVFISIMWFLFSLGISIQDSFGYLGENNTAHDLALGCLLCWLPILILCGIVDRNPVSSDDVQNQLNKLVNRVRVSLQDPAVRQDFINSISDHAERGAMRAWTETISRADLSHALFFKTFAGQGRLRWHYGVAHPILTDIETAYIKGQGRNWLHDEDKARHHLVLGEVGEGLDWFDYRELWQVLTAIMIVLGCVTGAWIISYMTPTVGLGCRSGGYTVFVTVSLGLLAIEMITWWVLDAEKRRLKTLAENVTRRASTFVADHNRTESWLLKVSKKFGLKWQNHLPLAFWGPATTDKADLALHHHQIQKRWSMFFFRPLEFGNMGHLIYLTLAQTMGADETCECMSSTWAKGGGYIDFTQYNVALSSYVRDYWIAGITITASIMGLSMLYIVTEWCLQSHLSTADMKAAANGLQRTRRFRSIVRLLTFRRASYSTTKGSSCTPPDTPQLLGIAPRVQVTSPPEDDQVPSEYSNKFPAAVHLEDRQSRDSFVRGSRRSSKSRSPTSISERGEGDFLRPRTGSATSERSVEVASLEPFPRLDRDDGDAIW